MHAMLTILALAAAVAPAGPGAMTEEQAGQLHQALVHMGAEAMRQESDAVRDHVMREGVDIAGRVAVFESFFRNYPFSSHHGENLAAHLLYGSADQERMGRFAGAFTATAVRIFWEEFSEHHAMPSLYALPLLEQLYNNSSEEMRKAIGNGIHDALNTKPLAVGRHFAGDGTSPLDIQLEAMQTCVTLGVFISERPVREWLVVPRTTASLMDAAAIWLFDGGVLDDEHVRCLKSIFDATPRALHGVVALFTPETAPVSAATSPLRLPGHALDLPLFPMNALRDMTEMPPHLSVPPTPEFALAALEQLMYAMLRVAHEQRPNWTRRLDAFLHQVAGMPTSPLESLAPMEVVLDGPEGFIAYLGVLWFVNAPALLEGALYLIEEYQIREPLFLLLMLADLFSEGGDATALYRTDTLGVVNATRAAIRRVHVSPDDSFVNGIAVGGRLWQYPLDDLARLF